MHAVLRYRWGQHKDKTTTCQVLESELTNNFVFLQAKYKIKLPPPWCRTSALQSVLISRAKYLTCLFTKK